MARLVLLHGFTQTGRSFDPLVPALAAAFDEVSAPDLPGHGPAPVAPTGLEAAADHAAAAGGRATYLGYSLGGRVALHLALARPELVERLVLVSTTAGLDDPAERAARRAADDALARSLEAEGLDAFLDRWMAQPLFAGLPAGAAGVDARRENTAAGLAGALRSLGLGAQAALWERLAELAMPVLVMAGEHDDRYRRLASRLVAAIGPNATLRIVPGAGHACHLERPAAFLNALSRK
jgi:2-succinyl-6-hydroxy-2,4-cyclohexadiene-1-carboxylate synthase